jgi:hypothetical protein
MSRKMLSFVGVAAPGAVKAAAAWRMPAMTLFIGAARKSRKIVGFCQVMAAASGKKR